VRGLDTGGDGRGGARGGEGGKASHSSLPLKTMETSLVMSLLLALSSNGWALVTEVNNKVSLKIAQNLFLHLRYSVLSAMRACWLLGRSKSDPVGKWSLGYTGVRVFRAPILKFVLFRSWLCGDVGVSFGEKLSWAIVGGDRIVLRILRLRRMKKILS
jgi:hypothetical protein